MIKLNKFLLFLLKSCLNSLWNFIDKNKDGKIDKAELSSIKGSVTRLKNIIAKQFPKKKKN